MIKVTDVRGEVHKFPTATEWETEDTVNNLVVKTEDVGEVAVFAEGQWVCMHQTVSGG